MDGELHSSPTVSVFVSQFQECSYPLAFRFNFPAQRFLKHASCLTLCKETTSLNKNCQMSSSCRQNSYRSFSLGKTSRQSTLRTDIVWPERQPDLFVRTATDVEQQCFWGHSLCLNRNVKNRICARGSKQNSHERNGSMSLELEILKFMESSDKPNFFPSKNELIEAGREDLVAAILFEGGWLIAGWDLESDNCVGADDDPSETSRDKTSKAAAELTPQNIGTEKGQKAGSLIAHEHDFGARDLDSTQGSDGWKFKDHQVRLKSKALGAKAVTTSDRNLYGKDLDISSKRRQGWENVARLFGLASSQLKPEHDRQSELSKYGRARQTIAATSLHGGALAVRKVSSPDSVPPTGLKPDFLQNKYEDESKPSQGLQQVQGKKKRKIKKKSKLSEAKTVDGNLNKSIDCIDHIVDRRENWMLKLKANSREKASVMQLTDSPVTISARIQHLELKLAATLAALQEGRSALLQDKGEMNKAHDRAIVELARISDALEFRENEILRTRADLRTTRAQLAALEGKMALELIETHKIIDEKDKQLEVAEKVLKMMRPVRVVWPNPASEVLLAGSFNGWSSQIKMEKSSAGVFVTSLQLHPGSYEIKFIVDGIWRVDPCRAIVYANHTENNLLVIV